MLARAINYGRSQAFPTCIGNFHMPYGRPFDIDNPRVAQELAAQPLVSVEVLRGELGKDEAVDYSSYSINELRSIAKGVGIKGSFYMKKAQLIQLLEEQNGT